MSKPEVAYALCGKLYCKSHKDEPWGFLTVPNALVRGLFDAVHIPGAELPPGGVDGKLEAHISVFRPEEIEQIGGPDKLTERGHQFLYSLGRFYRVEPKGWKEMSDCWFVRVHSPELEQLRKSYGLPRWPARDGHKLPFHISVAVRRKNVLKANELKKAASFVRVRVEADGGKHLLHHYLRDDRWDHPAGRIEEGETPSAAAVRELLERTGYQANAADLVPQPQEDDFAVFSMPMAKLKQVAQPGERGGYATEVRLSKTPTKMGSVLWEARLKALNARRNPPELTESNGKARESTETVDELKKLAQEHPEHFVLEKSAGALDFWLHTPSEVRFQFPVSCRNMIRATTTS